MGRIQHVEFGQSVLTYGTWNVQGLTELKLFELTLCMERYGIDILCLQETRYAKADVYTDRGYLFIVSGADDPKDNWAGVAFIVAFMPWCCHTACLGCTGVGFIQDRQNPTPV